jgi:predicted chitinase
LEKALKALAMTMTDIQFTPERWQQVFAAFKGEPQQLAGIEELRQAICQADPGLLTESASWLASYREKPPAPAWPLTKEQLGRIMLCSPSSLPDSLMDDLAAAANTFHLDNLNLAYFLGQCGEESGGLRYPVEIASGAAYEGRRDLGNLNAGDGVKFAGTGWIQVTGRYNHQAFSDYLNSIGKYDPKIMEIGKTYTSEVYPWSISAFWWFNNGMISYCKQRPDVDHVGQRVNGQYPPRGAAERRAYTARAFKELGE